MRTVGNLWWSGIRVGFRLDRLAATSEDPGSHNRPTCQTLHNKITSIHRVHHSLIVLAVPWNLSVIRQCSMRATRHAVIVPRSGSHRNLLAYLRTYRHQEPVEVADVSHRLAPWFRFRRRHRG